MADIVIPEFMDEDAVAALAAEFNVAFDPDLVERTDDLIAAIPAVRGLIVRNRTQVRGALLEAATSLRVVGRLGVGIDNVDMDVCRDRGIQVFPATGANSESVAEHVIAGLLMLFRGAYHANASMLAGDWPRMALTGREINGRRLGLVGLGGIARVVALKARALGMAVVAHDPLLAADDPVWIETGVTAVTFDGLLETSDAVSLHVPLNDATRHLMDAVAIARMRPVASASAKALSSTTPPRAVLIRTATGRIAGAVMDVFDREPMTADNPFIDVPNVILTPHIAGVTEESNIRVSRVAADHVRRVLREEAET